MTPDENAQTDPPADENPPAAQDDRKPILGQLAEEDEWSGVGEKPLKEHVRNDTTVDLEEGGRVGVTMGEPVDDWAGDYPARPDAEARDPNATPPYDPSRAASRSQYLANGPGYEADFDVHDYVEEAAASGVNLSGYVTPTYD